MHTVARSIFSALVLATTAAAIHPSLSALCPKPKPGEITICADGEPPRSPYRLPEDPNREPEVGSPESISVSRERNGLFDYDAGGIGSCSTSGSAGQSGCGFLRHKRWVEQRGMARDPRGPAFDKRKR